MNNEKNSPIRNNHTRSILIPWHSPSSSRVLHCKTIQQYRISHIGSVSFECNTTPVRFSLLSSRGHTHRHTLTHIAYMYAHPRTRVPASDICTRCVHGIFSVAVASDGQMRQERHYRIVRSTNNDIDKVLVATATIHSCFEHRSLTLCHFCARERDILSVIWTSHDLFSNKID